MTVWLATLLVPLGLWALGRGLAEREAPAPSVAVHGLFGFAGAAGLLCWRGRPFVEQAAAWVVGVLAWGGLFLIRDLQVFAAFGLVGAAWGAGLGMMAGKPPAAAPAQSVTPPQRAPVAPHQEVPPAERCGFALELRCPTCGALLAVPVYHRMAHCQFCSSDHVVTGDPGTLTVVIPDAVTDEGGLAQSVVRHLRDRRYLELYDARVRPMASDAGFVASPRAGEPPLLGPGPDVALVNALEAEVSKAADEWASRLAPKVHVRAWRRFLTPYWHRLGTLYQAAFGRDRDANKRMEFAVVTIEASVSANRFPVPEMGKLSYLRALRPLLGSPESAYPALAGEFGPEELDHKAQPLSRRSTELTITPIAMHSTLVPEVVALVYRPWHLADVDVDGEALSVLVDGGSGRVEGDAPAERLPDAPLPEVTAQPPQLAPSRCPECGADLPFAPDSVAFLCRSCFRLVELRGARWVSVPYLREEPSAGGRQVPFWRFPLRIRTAGGAVITDLPHLTDGIDGTFDQIGDRPQVVQSFFVPAFRIRVTKAGVQLYRRLWPEVQERPRRLRPERFGPADAPSRTVEVTMTAAEARVFGRVYLALAFTPRDLARAEVKGVRERFLSAEFEGDAELAFLDLPEELVGPLDGVAGRPRLAALVNLEEKST
ncbi:MAG TPA: hypothetical protein VMT19_11775 [Thermoanaerobaculaceae bacterium]|nr:hypothetical protein [Thermoanaerobaculaceae bacterium]